jgi:hypothetical protein
MLPSEDPDRVEVLAVTRYQVEGNKTDLVLLEMIRDSAGQLVELRPFDYPQASSGVQAQSPLVDAFVGGFRSSVGGKHN